MPVVSPINGDISMMNLPLAGNLIQMYSNVPQKTNPIVQSQIFPFAPKMV